MNKNIDKTATISDNTPVEGWNYVPKVPLQVSPYFSWPPKPINMVRWLLNSWFLLTERLIIIGIAFASFYWLQPPLEQTQTLSFDWIFSLYIRNLILFSVVAGGLHWYFHGRKIQGKKLKYDLRDLIKRGRQFTLNRQIFDNMFWSLTSGVTVWTAYEILMFYALSNGYVPLLTWAAHPVWFLALFVLIPIWESFYFYWIHRLLHVPIFYRWMHALHHRNIDVGPWSGLSMHPGEHIIFLGSVLIHFICGAHPVHILFHMQYLTLTAVTSHTGFEALLVKDKKALALGTFHHQMHHRYFECNYGSLEVPWDQVFGSFHDGTKASNQRIKQRRRRMHKS